MAEESTETAEAPPAPPRADAVQELEERFARGLDKVAPLPKTTPVASADQATETPPAPAPTQPELPKPKPREPARKEPPRDEPTQLLPSFLEKPAPVETQPVEEEPLPEELPGAKGEQAKANWKKFRSQHDARLTKIKEQENLISELQAQIGKPDPATSERLKRLEEENAQLLTVTERVSIHNHPRFQAEVLQPRNNALEYAKTIVRDAGGNPVDLEKAVSLSGQAHYAALEDLYSTLPEVAKGELSAVIKDIRLYDRRRDQILSDPKRSLDAIRKEDLVAQQRQLESQQREGDQMLERILTRMREHSKVEVLQRSNDPRDKWWNDQVDQIENTARQLAKTHDPEQLMAALALAPMADVYRKLFLDSQQQLSHLKQRVASFDSHEPVLDGEPEPATAKEQRKKDMDKPIGQAFREILNRNRRQ